MQIEQPTVGLNAQIEQPMALSDLTQDTLAHLVLDHLSLADLGNLCQTNHAMCAAVNGSERLWAALLLRHFPSAAVPTDPLGGRREFLHTHTTCHQLRSRNPAVREWSADASAVGFIHMEGCGTDRIILAAQVHLLNIRLANDKAYQLLGHTARLTCSRMVRLPGSNMVGIISGSADRSVRLWAVDAAPNDVDLLPVQLVTSSRTLRAHDESLTSLELLTSSAGVLGVR